MSHEPLKAVTQRLPYRLRSFVYSSFALAFGLQVFFTGYSFALLSYVFPFLVFVSFSSLTTTLYRDRLVVSFFFGFPARTILLSEINSVSITEVSRLHGYGVRVMRDGFMWRIAGRRVIRLHLSSGRSFYFGVPNPYFFAGGPLSSALGDTPAETQNSNL